MESDHNDLGSNSILTSHQRADPPLGNEFAASAQDHMRNPLPLPCLPASRAAGADNDEGLGRAQVLSSISVQIPPYLAADGKVVTSNRTDGLAAEGEFDTEEDKKPDREHKKRSKNWTRAESLTLIRLRTHLAPRFTRTSRKSELWDEIADALRKDHFCRDAQQCRDKWEKLVTGYREVREGLKQREDNPFYDKLHALLAGRSSRRDRDRQDAAEEDGNRRAPRSSFDPQLELSFEALTNAFDEDRALNVLEIDEYEKSKDDQAPEEEAYAQKRRRSSKFAAVGDLHAVQNLLETIIGRQQRFFIELLDTMERKEQLREQLRQEREERWRAEERAHRGVFTEAMIVLSQKLGCDRGAPPAGIPGPLICSPLGHQVHKRRSKNWKRGEVLQLITLRGEMENKFSKCIRRAGLWEELAEMLGIHGIKRDGKQCREKWDKLMSEYKDVLDGRREQADSPYFTELTVIVGGRPGEAA